MITLHPPSGTLTDGTRTAHLGRNQARVIAFLARQSRPVPRKVLRDALWPDGASDITPAVTISHARKRLAEAGFPGLITLGKRGLGCTLTAPVQVEESAVTISGPALRALRELLRKAEEHPDLAWLARKVGGADA